MASQLRSRGDTMQGRARLYVVLDLLTYAYTYIYKQRHDTAVKYPMSCDAMLYYIAIMERGC